MFVARGSQSIKIDIGKSFDKSISIDKLNLNDIHFNRSIDKIRYSHADEVLTLSILSDSLIFIESIKIIRFRCGSV